MRLPEALPPARDGGGRDERTGFRYVLAQPSFRLIWFAQLASQLADKFLMFSLVVLAYHLTRSSTLVASTLLAYTVPAVAIAPLAGVFADRHDRKAIMVFTTLLRGGVVALIPLAALVPSLRGDFGHLLALTLLFAAIGQFFSPAEAAAIPSVLPKRALLPANSMVMMTMVLTLVVGGTMAPLVSRWDLYAPYWLTSLLMFLAGGLILFAQIPRQEPLTHPPGKSRPFKKLWYELREAWTELKSKPLLLVAFYELSLAVLVLLMMFTLAPAYVSRVVGIEAQDSYVILVPATGGAILSALFVGMFGRHLSRSRLLVGSLVLTGLTLLALAVSPTAMEQIPELRGGTRPLTATFGLLLGLEFGALIIPGVTYLMEKTEDAVRGRVFALLFMVINGVTAIPVLVAAALADLVGIERVIAGLGALLIVTGAGVAAILWRSGTSAQLEPA
jgi:MFS family permease